MPKTDEFLGSYFEVQSEVIKEQKNILNDVKASNEQVVEKMQEMVGGLVEMSKMIFSSSNTVKVTNKGTDILIDEELNRAGTTSQSNLYIGDVQCVGKIKLKVFFETYYDFVRAYEIYLKQNGTNIGWVQSPSGKYQSKGEYVKEFTLTVNPGDEITVNAYGAGYNEHGIRIQKVQYIGKYIDEIVI